MKKERIIPIPNPGMSSGMYSPDMIVTDPQGSYTGRPEDEYEVPVQDVDDL